MCSALHDTRSTVRATGRMRGLLREPAPHVRVGLGEDEPIELSIVLEVPAGAGADLEHVPAQLGSRALLRHASPHARSMSRMKRS